METWEDDLQRFMSEKEEDDELFPVLVFLECLLSRKHCGLFHECPLLVKKRG
jgi:hypothetical protein